MVRKHLKGVYFDEVGTSKGITRLEGYKKRFSRTENRFIDEPDKSNGCSEGADAFRQFAQAKERGLLTQVHRSTSNTRAPDWRL